MLSKWARFRLTSSFFSSLDGFSYGGDQKTRHMREKDSERKFSLFTIQQKPDKSQFAQGFRENIMLMDLAQKH